MALTEKLYLIFHMESNVKRNKAAMKIMQRPEVKVH